MAKTGIGRLIYVIGPSGAGKDSVINYARDRLGSAGDDGTVVIARRYITRPPADVGESHIPLSPACFAARLQAGAFALSWRANGLSYGIGSEIDDWLRTGRQVIVNGSRAHLPMAMARYPRLLPILISIDPAILHARLLARGRETHAEIAARIERAISLTVEHPTLQTVRNDGALSSAGEAFLTLIRDARRYR